MKNHKNKEEEKTWQASGLRRSEEPLCRNEGLLRHGEEKWPKWPPTGSLQLSNALPRQGTVHTGQNFYFVSESSIFVHR